MDLTDTFHQEDTVTLTEEEKKEALRMQKEESHLRRQNQLAHQALMAKQRAEQSVPIETVPASKPVFDATQAPMDFQPTKTNQPQGSDVTLKDPQGKLDSGPPKYRPHPTYQPSGQHPSPISIPRPVPSDTPSHLMPIHASSTQVLLNNPTPSTAVTTSAGEVEPPTTKVTAVQSILSTNDEG